MNILEQVELFSAISKENMQALFEENFGGWSDTVNKEKIRKSIEEQRILTYKKEAYLSYTKQENTYIIQDLQVTKEKQHQGIGKKLLTTLITKAKKENIQQLQLNVFNNNTAKQFYEKQGFKEEKKIDKSNSILMTKQLFLLI